MPARVDILAATPRCPQTRLDPAGGLGHVRCDGKLHYTAGRNAWHCDRCGRETPGGELVAARDTISSRTAA